MQGAGVDWFICCASMVWRSIRSMGRASIFTARISCRGPLRSRPSWDPRWSSPTAVPSTSRWPSSSDRLAVLDRQLDVIQSCLTEHGVVLALEVVMPGPATDLVPLALEDRDPSRFGFCYDSAHDQIGVPRPLWSPADWRSSSRRPSVGPRYGNSSNMSRRETGSSTGPY